MILRHLYLQNYRVYEGVCELDFPEGLVGIYGPNGAGKSYLIEAIPYALFGYTRDKAEPRTTDVNDECIVELTFEHEGQTYVVRRTAKGGGKNLQKSAEVHCNGMQMATGLNDSKRFVHQLLGVNQAGFMASVFAEQKQLAALSAQTGATRRKLVLDLLGITPMAKAVDTAREDYREAQRVLSELEGIADNLDELATKRDDAAAAVVAAGAETTNAKAALDAARLAAETARATFDSITKAIEDGRAVASQFAELETRVKELTESVEHIAAARHELTLLGDTRPALDEARSRLELVRTLAAAAATKAKAEAAVAALGEIGAATDPPDDREAVRARQVAAAAENDVAALKATVAAKQAVLDQASAALLRTEDLEGEADCPMCDRALGPDELANVRNHRLADVDKARAEHEQADKAARKAAKTAAEAGALATAAEKALSEAKQRWRDQAAARDKQSTALAARQAAVDAYEHALAAAKEAGIADVDLATAEAAASLAEDADRRATKLQGELTRASQTEADLVAVTAKRDEVGADLERRRAQAKEQGHSREGLAKAQEQRDATAQAVVDAEARHTRAISSEATAVADAKHAEDTYERARERNERIQPMRDESLVLGRLSELLKSFKDHEAATVGPRLAGHARDLFDRMTDGMYNGLDLTDDFSVQLTDANKTFDIKRFSGSEVDLANLALRIAISECVTLQSGGAVGLLVLDEVFGPLDQARRGRLLDALTNLQTRFKQVLVVTHADDVKEQLPSSIEVRVTGERRATAVVV